MIIIIYLIFKITGTKGLDTSIKESKYKYNLAHWIEEIAGNTKSFKIYNDGNLHLNKTDEINVSYLKSRQSHFKVLVRQFIMFIGFKVWVAAALLVVGGYLVFQNQMNIGQFVASEIIIITIVNSVEKIIKIIETIYDVLTALDKIGFVTDLPIDTDSGLGELNSEKGLDLEISNLNFQYPNEDKPLFKNLCIKIESGDKVLLKGASGAGKSTLLNILARITAVKEGKVFINNRPARYYTHESYNKHLGLINPTSGIFEGTIEENILMNRDIPQENLEEVLDLVGLTHQISRLKNGIQSTIDSEGRRMSRSAIQKVLLCRTLVGKPKLLLLKDPLQFIKEEEKKAIIDYIMSSKRDWTVIVIADYNYWTDKCNKTIKL